MTTSPTATGPAFRLSAETLIAKPPFGNDMELGTIMFIISVCICGVGFTAGFLMYLKQSREQQNRDEDKIIKGRARRAASFDASMLDEGGGGGGGFGDYLLTQIDDEMNGGRKVERVVRGTASTSTNAVGGGGGGGILNNNNSNGHGVNQSIQRYIDDAYSSHLASGGSANPYSYGNNGSSNQPPLQVGGVAYGNASDFFTAGSGGALPLPEQPPPIPPPATRRTMPPHADSDDLLMFSSTPSTPSRRGDGLAGELGGPNRAYSTMAPTAGGHSVNDDRNGRESSTPTSLSSLPSPTRSSLNSPPQATNTTHNNNASLRQDDDAML